MAPTDELCGPCAEAIRGAAAIRATATTATASFFMYAPLLRSSDDACALAPIAGVGRDCLVRRCGERRSAQPRTMLVVVADQFERGRHGFGIEHFRLAARQRRVAACPRCIPPIPDKAPNDRADHSRGRTGHVIIPD